MCHKKGFREPTFARQSFKKQTMHAMFELKLDGQKCLRWCLQVTFEAENQRVGASHRASTNFAVGPTSKTSRI